MKGAGRVIIGIGVTALLAAASFWLYRYVSVEIRGTFWQGLLRGTFWNEIRLILAVCTVFVFLSLCEKVLSRTPLANDDDGQD